MEKFYSEVTKKYYLTEEGKKAEEKAYQDMISEEERKAKKLAEEKANRLKEIADQSKKMNEEIDKYNELVNKFNKDYNGYHNTTYKTNLKRPADVFEILMSMWPF